MVESQDQAGSGGFGWKPRRLKWLVILGLDDWSRVLRYSLVLLYRDERSNSMDYLGFGITANS